MASKNYNAGIQGILDRTIDFAGGTINIMIVQASYTFNQDETSMTTAAASELSVGGYSRKTLGSKTITKDNTNDRTTFDAADPTAWTLVTGQTAAGAIIFWNNVNDAGSVPITFLDFTDTPTNGSAFTIQFDSAGIFYIQN